MSCSVKFLTKDSGPAKPLMTRLSPLWMMCAALIIAFVVPVEDAQARKRFKREGFNFGATMHVQNVESTSYPSASSPSTTQSDGDFTNVSPWLGYAFGPINLGLMANVESQKSSSHRELQESGTIVDTESNMKTQGTNVFVRFLFGNVFFFEGAVGIYSRKIDILEKESEPTSDNVYTTTNSEFQVKGIGPGYQFAGGIELPITDGFFFSSAYETRIISLKKQTGSTSLGEKSAAEEKKMVRFGLGHYFK